MLADYNQLINRSAAVNRLVTHLKSAELQLRLPALHQLDVCKKHRHKSHHSNNSTLAIMHWLGITSYLLISFVGTSALR